MLYNKILFILLISFSLLTGLSCSSTAIKELSDIELAQQIILERQETSKEEAAHSIKIHVTQPEKVVVGKRLDLDIELVSKEDLPELTLVYEEGNGLKLTRKWLLLKQPSIKTVIKNIKADKIYRHTVSLIPEEEGLLEFKLYLLYGSHDDKKARQQSIHLSIGNSLALEKQQASQ